MNSNILLSKRGGSSWGFLCSVFLETSHVSLVISLGIFGEIGGKASNSLNLIKN